MNIIFRLLVCLFISSFLLWSAKLRAEDMVYSSLAEIVKVIAVHQEDKVSVIRIDFNQDGQEDLFVANVSESSAKGTYEHGLFLGVDKGYMGVKNSDAFVQLGNINQCEGIDSLVIKSGASSGAVIYISAAYLDHENHWVSEIIEKSCKPMEDCSGIKEQLGIFKNFICGRIDLQNEQVSEEVFSPSQLLNSVDFESLPKKNENPIYKWQLSKINFKVNPKIYRVFDRKNNNFLGYMDKSWDNNIKNFKDVFVSLMFKNDGTFEVVEEFGKEPHLRLEKTPNELPGTIDGAPIREVEKTVQAAQKTEVIQVADISKPIETATLEIETEKRLGNKYYQWLYWLLGLAALFVMILWFKKNRN